MDIIISRSCGRFIYSCRSEIIIFSMSNTIVLMVKSQRYSKKIRNIITCLQQLHKLSLDTEQQFPCYNIEEVEEMEYTLGILPYYLDALSVLRLFNLYSFGVSLKCFLNT